MNRRYQLKPHASSKHPHLKWAVSGDSDDGTRRWRRLFETRSEAENFLREKQGDGSGDGGVESVAQPALPKARRDRREVAAKKLRRPGWFRTLSARLTNRQLTLMIAIALIAGFFIDRTIRRGLVPPPDGTVLRETFERNPILSGWQTSNEGTDWTSATSFSGARSVEMQRGIWSSPWLQVQPSLWYRITFRSKSARGEARAEEREHGVCEVSFRGADGVPAKSTKRLSIRASDEWRTHELLVLVPALAEDPTKRAGVSMQLVFTPVNMQEVFLDDVVVDLAPML